MAFLATLLAIISSTSEAKEKLLKITSSNGEDTQVVNFENPDVTCTLDQDYPLPDISDNLVIPDHIFDPCIILVDDEEALLTGGQASNSDRPKSRPRLSKKTKFFSDEEWQPAPSMKVKRVNHGCGHFMHGETEVFVVAGGENRFLGLSSTEFLPKRNGHWANWMYGPRLPNRMKDLTMVSAQDTVYVLPAQPGPILKLQCSPRSLYSCRWVETGQRLNLDGGSLATEWIEDEQMVNCELKTTTTTTTTPSPRPRTTTVRNYDENNPIENEVDLPRLTEDVDAEDICGLRFNGHGASKIIGGRKANFGDWPWQVLM